MNEIREVIVTLYSPTDELRNCADEYYGEAVELIHCKDCKWYYGDYCGGFGDGAFTSEDGFCHNAERKEECGHQ